jgi:hypothetical protein
MVSATTLQAELTATDLTLLETLLYAQITSNIDLVLYKQYNGTVVLLEENKYFRTPLTSNNIKLYRQNILLQKLKDDYIVGKWQVVEVVNPDGQFLSFTPLIP